MSEITLHALQNIEEFLDTLMENLPIAVFIKDARDLRFVRFNKAAEEMFGYSREEMLGKNDHDLFPKDQADFFTSKDREVLQNKVLVDIPEEPIQTKNNGQRFLHTRKIPLLDKNGEAVYLVGISEDITDKKLMNDNLRAHMQEAEKLNNALIGRESEMLDMRNEIERLKKELAAKGG